MSILVAVPGRGRNNRGRNISFDNFLTKYKQKEVIILDKMDNFISSNL